MDGCPYETLWIKNLSSKPPRIARSLSLDFIGDWGGANFHRICSWLTQEFCDRAGPRSRTSIHSSRGGGFEALQAVHDGEADLCISTPAMVIEGATNGRGFFSGRPMPALRALAVLPQNDRLVLAVRGDLQINSFEELRRQKPSLRIATSLDDPDHLIGWTAARYMEAHGIDSTTLVSWGGGYVSDTRPEQSLFRMRDGLVDAVLQEAIMTPWWRDVIATGAVPLAAEESALKSLESEFGFRRNQLPRGFWSNLEQDLPTLDFSDFAIVVREDLAEDVAHLLTWCLVETRQQLEAQYRHLAPERSPLSYPLSPEAMARPPLPLHAGAARYYQEAGLTSA